MSNYLIELSVVHIILIGAYWVFLRNENQFGKMRAYILGATIFSLIIPLFKLPKLFVAEKASEMVYAAELVPIDGFSVTPAASQGLNFDFLLWGYVLVSLFFLIRFLITVFHLVKLEHESKSEPFNNTRIRRAQGIDGSFTFFNWIFLAEDVRQDDQEYDVILRHERAHAALGHTYDLIFLELFKIAFWWLPSAWFTQKEIKKIHEYQADAYAIKSYSIDRYSSILISSTLKTNGLSLASSFHDGLIFKRLNAMKQKAKNVSPWKLGAITALTAIVFVVFACSEEMEENIQKMGEASNSISFEQLPANMQANLKDIQNDLTFIKVDMNDQTADIKSSMGEIEGLKDLDPSTIHSMNVVKEDGEKAIYIALKKDGVNFDYLADKSKSDGEVFTIVENAPEPQGGMEAYYQFIAQNLTYPEDARKQGIEGPVYVQFIVAKDGSIQDVQAVKGIGGGCDEEAVRVVKSSPNFRPGKQRGKAVAVRMVLPIHFKLDGEGHSEKHGSMIIEKVDMNLDKLDVQASYANGLWSGTVRNKATGEAMAGVSIVEKGTNSGTVTDLDGTFKLKMKDEANDVILSYVGFQSSKLANSVTVKGYSTN
jgi:TonB family protein